METSNTHADYVLPPRGFFFWSLAPFLIIFLVVMPLAVDLNNAGAAITLATIELLAALVLIGLFNPYRFWWAWRGVGAIVFLGYVAYLIAMLIESGGKIVVTPRKSEASAFNAICGLIVFGLPGLWYAFFGRLSFRKEESSEDFSDDDS